jgi:hypothetical protein
VNELGESLTKSMMQGEVYRVIIDKIILAAQTDFEEGGYTQETLQELKLVSEDDAQSSIHPTPCGSAMDSSIKEFTLSSRLARGDAEKCAIWLKCGGSPLERRRRRVFRLESSKRAAAKMKKKIAGEPLYFRKPLIKPCRELHSTCHSAPTAKPRDALASALASFLHDYHVAFYYRGWMLTVSLEMAGEPHQAPCGTNALGPEARRATRRRGVKREGRR